MNRSVRTRLAKLEAAGSPIMPAEFEGLPAYRRGQMTDAQRAISRCSSKSLPMAGPERRLPVLRRHHGALRDERTQLGHSARRGGEEARCEAHLASAGTLQAGRGHATVGGRAAGSTAAGPHSSPHPSVATSRKRHMRKRQTTLAIHIHLGRKAASRTPMAGCAVSCRASSTPPPSLLPFSTRSSAR